MTESPFRRLLFKSKGRGAQAFISGAKASVAVMALLLGAVLTLCHAEPLYAQDAVAPPATAKEAAQSEAAQSEAAQSEAAQGAARKARISKALEILAAKKERERQRREQEARADRERAENARDALTKHMAAQEAAAREAAAKQARAAAAAEEEVKRQAREMAAREERDRAEKSRDALTREVAAQEAAAQERAAQAVAAREAAAKAVAAAKTERQRQAREAAARKEREMAEKSRDALTRKVAADEAAAKARAQLRDDARPRTNEVVAAPATVQDLTGAVKQERAPVPRADPTAKPAKKKLAMPTAPKKPALPKEKVMPAPAESRDLVVASWGGGYMRAQERAVFGPFARSSNLQLTSMTHGGDGNELNGAGGKRPDVVDLGSMSLAKACAAGALLPLDDLELAATRDGGAAAQDLIDGARTRCGIGSLAWSHVILVRNQAFKRRKPRNAAHLFDSRRYPGKRAFVKRPRYLIELALMADGVAPAQVYRTLDSDEGLDRALKKIEGIVKQITWADKVADVYKLIESGKAAMGGGFSGRAFRMKVADPRLGVIWDNQIYDVDYWAIPRTARNPRAARRFIAFATAPKQLAATSEFFPYGPMRKSAVEMVGRHNVLDIKLQSHLPTSAANLKTALRFDAAWWVKNGKRVRARWASWLKELNAPPPPPVRNRRRVGQ